MRIITDSDGRVLDVSFGALISCGGQDGTDYTGTVPTGYTSLEDWFIKEADKLYRWTVVDGELTLDSSAVAPVDLPVADYIVEQGTSGIWTYEKWNSGKAVCRGTIQGATGTFTSHGIGVYYSKAISTRLPNNLFSTVSYAIPTMISGGGGLLLPRTAGVSVSVVQVDFVRFYGGSDSLNIQYAIEVKGKWK